MSTFTLNKKSALYYIFREKYEVFWKNFDGSVDKFFEIANKKFIPEPNMFKILFTTKEEWIARINGNNEIRKKSDQISNIWQSTLEILKKLNNFSLENSYTDSVFNIEKLKYQGLECKELEIIYDKNSTKDVIELLKLIFSLAEQIKLMNEEIDDFNSKNGTSIKKTHLRDYVSFSAHPALKCISNLQFRQKYNTSLDRNGNAVFSEESVALIMMLKVFYFYSEKINAIYGQEIFGDRNIQVRTKIVFDVCAAFFQRCIDFCFAGNTELIEKYRDCLQTEMEAFFYREFGNNVVMNFDNIELKHFFALRERQEYKNYRIVGSVKIENVKIERALNQENFQNPQNSQSNQGQGFTVEAAEVLKKAAKSVFGFFGGKNES
jgi:hypothetical protein